MRRFLKSKKFQRILGCCLIVVGIVSGLGWFGWLKPIIDRADPLWSERFTRKTFWDQVQQHIRRYGWRHDDFVVVGKYGDKIWAEWIMAKAHAGEDIADCGDVGHKDAALNYITSQNPAAKTNIHTTPFWLGWWETNKQKSQIEWIRDGLKGYGVQLEIPPSNKDYMPLLALLGNSSTNESDRIPGFAKYNAFRWLRDSEFNSIAFALSNINAHTPDSVRHGVISFHKYEKAWPREDGVGLLEFSPSASDEVDSGFSYGHLRNVRVAAYSMMVFPALAGVCLLAFSARRPKQSHPQTTPRPAA